MDNAGATSQQVVDNTDGQGAQENPGSIMVEGSGDLQVNGNTITKGSQLYQVFGRLMSSNPVVRAN